MRLAAIDRLVHHATILEMNVESYRRRAALQRKRGKTVQPSWREAAGAHGDHRRDPSRQMPSL